MNNMNQNPNPPVEFVVMGYCSNDYLCRVPQIPIDHKVEITEHQIQGGGPAADAAVAAARSVGVEPEAALDALSRFPGVHRRQEVKGEAWGCRVIDDFAHHPTAIRETIHAVRRTVPEGGRLFAILEPRSNTMKLGAMKAKLADALAEADRVFCYAGPGVRWEPAQALSPLGAKAFTTHDFDALVSSVLEAARPGDVLLCMSNGGFGGIHGKLLAGLRAREGRAS